MKHDVGRIVGLDVLHRSEGRLSERGPARVLARKARTIDCRAFLATDLEVERYRGLLARLPDRGDIGDEPAIVRIGRGAQPGLIPVSTPAR